MRSKVLISVFVLLCGLLCFNLGCNPKGTGTLQLNLTDKPADEIYEQVVITFSQISVHKGLEQDVIEATQDEEGDNNDDAVDGDGGWIVINDDEQTFDLLQLQDGKFDLLAQDDLTEGVYTQIRLKIADGNDENGDPKTYVKLAGDDTKYPLIIPSGLQSGLKLIHPFRIMADSITVLYLDFNAEKSLIKTGNGQYKLKPTIAVLYELYKQGIIGKVISAEESAEPIPVVGAAISAYSVEAMQDDDTDNDLPVGSTVTDEAGDFTLPLPPGTYTLQVEAEGYQAILTEEINVVIDVWNTLTEPIKLDPLVSS
jgi:hypothetical protein